MKKNGVTSAKTKPSSRTSRFVIQQHAGRSRHYDFRLQYKGVLVSWAIPKGPSTNPAKKQLALRTDDHPLDYANFEGIIPEGQYGAGPVIVWDRGVYKNLKKFPLSKCLEQGELNIWLEGEKLKGAYALMRFSLNKKEAWLLIKMNDEYANPKNNITKRLPTSVISGKTIEEII